jgi:type 1 glutamine amidotransferase/HEAT repeat protein
MRYAKIVLGTALLLLATGISPASAQLSQEEGLRILEASPPAATVKPKAPRLLLVFSLSEGFKHGAIPRAAKALEIMGKKTGAFETVQSEDLSFFRPENLKRFDAVCFNNTTQLKFDDPALRASLLDFVAGGKGIVGIHAATDNFPTWPEAQALFGGVFDGHPWHAGGTWAVRIADPDHPLTASFKGKDFLINDEIYRIRPVELRKNSRVLLALDMRSERNRKAAGVRPTDRDIPISWVRSYGKGRLFYCSLGHNDSVYVNPAVLQHYLDGVQFAVGDLQAETSPLPFDPMSVFDQTRLTGLLRGVSTYRYGDSRAALAGLDGFIRDVEGSPQARLTMERQFLDLLAGEATPAGRQFICQKLALVGSGTSVPLLAGVLADSSTAEMALIALEPIPGSGADSALQRALTRTEGKTKIGVITALGNRRVEGATKELVALVRDPDSRVSAASVSALGRIGTPAALDALEQSRIATNGRRDILDAMLVSADRFRRTGDNDRALGVYRKLDAPGGPLPIRCAALRGRVLTDPASAVSVLTDALRSKDAQFRAAAARLVSELPDGGQVRAIAQLLPDLAPSVQVQLLSALSRTRDPEVQKIVMTQAASRHAEVRLVALRTLGAMGDSGAVPLLVQIASTSGGTEQKEARTSLYGLQSPGVDEALLASLRRADNKKKVELIRALAERRVVSSVPLLLDAAGDPSRPVRGESVRALKSLAGPPQVGALVELLVRTRDDGERRELEPAVAAAAGRNPDAGRQDEAVLAAYPEVRNGEARASLINVLGKIGAPASLPLLRESIRDGDPEVRRAAIRALSDWPTAEPFDDLWRVASGGKDAGERTLALRGSVRLLGLDDSRSAEETMRRYRDAMKIVPNAGERKALLSAVGGSHSVAGLKMAAGYLADADLRLEAEAATLNIAEAIADSSRREVIPQLRQVMASSTRKENITRAGDLIKKIELFDDCITAWDYAGPYQHEGARLLNEPFGPELSTAQPVPWSPLRTATDPGKPWLLDFTGLSIGDDNVVYIRTNVWSPADQNASLEMGTDYGVKAWVNGKLVHAASVVRRVAPGNDHVPVILQKGWNVLMFKLEQGDGAWRACARVRASDGGALEGIRISTKQN